MQTAFLAGEDKGSVRLPSRRRDLPAERCVPRCLRLPPAPAELAGTGGDAKPQCRPIQYELAAMCDIDGGNLESLLLHLDNRVHHPRLLRGRYRLTMSLSMLADPLLESQWWAPGTRVLAAYNAACLCALRRSSGLPDPGSAETSVRLLRLAAVAGATGPVAR